MNDAPKWRRRFYDMALMIATWSKDPKRQVGAVVVTSDCRNISVGYNGFPRGVEDTKIRLADEEERQALTVHAELNAIYNTRFDIRSCTIYSTKFPCHECAKGIIQVGIARVVSPQPTNYGDLPGTWALSQKLANLMLREASIVIVDINARVL